VEDEHKPVKLKADMKGTNHLHQVKNLTHTQVIGRKKKIALGTTPQKQSFTLKFLLTL
jgi:hypothetical protein